MNPDTFDEKLLRRALARLQEMDVPGREDLEACLESFQDMQIYQEELKIQAEDLQRKQRELEALQHLYFQYFDMSPVPIFRVSGDGLIRQCNLKASELFQIDRQQLTTSETRALLKSLEGASFNRFKHCLEEAVEKNSSVTTTIDMKLHGEEEFFRVEAIAVEGATPDTPSEPEIQVVVFLTELTDYRNRELELRTMEAALEQNPSAVFMTTPDGRFHYVNPRFESLYGYLWEDLKGESTSILKSGAHSPKFYRQMWSALQRGDIWKGEIINRKANGSKVVVRATVFPIYGYQGQIAYYIAIQEDISAEKSAREQLDLYTGFAEAVNFSVVFTNPQREVTWVNSAFEQMTGYRLSEVLGKNLKNVLQGDQTDPATTREMHEHMEAGKPFECEIINYSKAGGAYWVHLQIEPIYDDRGNLTHFVSIQNDITERKKLEKKINQKQRMESIGALAGGMAHDINNLLQPISLGIDQLQERQFDTHPESAELLEMMRESVNKAAGTIRQILTFARGGEQEQKVIDILPLLRQTNQLAMETVPRQIQIEFTANEGPLYVRIAPTQVTQVLMNLILNARDAIEGSGKIQIRVHPDIPPDFSSMTILGKLPEKKSVWIEVSDNGCGIPRDKQQEIFEPFYSTKSQDHGTGMGLATAYGIIKNLRGCVLVRSDENSGSSFFIGLPLATAEEAEKNQPSPQSRLPREASATPPLIVVVDDEKAIGRSLGTVFNSQGYRVEVFDSSLRALDWFSAEDARPDLLLVDYMMPEMDGVALVEKVRESRPELPVILMTGVQDAAADQRFEEAGIQNVLSKPFDVGVLMDRIASVLPS